MARCKTLTGCAKTVQIQKLNRFLCMVCTSLKHCHSSAAKTCYKFLSTPRIHSAG
ncbi:hypothetical protein EPYR_01313 [Erwinia pyrifoliae DSM 12163]|nr:hypothetical protein EPYR_01313 [Erwinia pyrifoliae DSM 12163]